MRNKKLINRKKTTLHKDGSSALLYIALEKEGEKKKKNYYNTGCSYLVTHPSTISAEDVKTFVLDFIQCRTFLTVLYRVRNAQSVFYTWVHILYPVRNA